MIQYIVTQREPGYLFWEFRWTMTGKTAALLTLFTLLHPSALGAGEATNRPNILLITADDLGNQLSCYVNYPDPHGPYTPHVRQVEGLPKTPMDPEKVIPLPLRAPRLETRRRMTALIYDCIARVDVGAGMLLDELTAAGFAETTLVIFIGDNGAVVRHGKCTNYEPGVQVPLLVRWPGRVRASQVRDELVSAVDLMPTILKAAGVAVPERLAGQPLQPLFEATPPKEWREYLFTEGNFHTANMYRPQRTVRDDRFKLLLNLEPSSDQEAVELFDLRDDPGETTNLATDAAFSKQRARLEAALQKWREQTNDPLLDATRRKRWSEVARQWAESAPRLNRGPYPDVARVPPGGLRLLE